MRAARRTAERENSLKIGLDIGSTTIKCVVLDDALNITYKTYERHFSHIVEKAAELVQRQSHVVVGGAKIRAAGHDLAVNRGLCGDNTHRFPRKTPR